MKPTKVKLDKRNSARLSRLLRHADFAKQGGFPYEFKAVQEGATAQASWRVEGRCPGTTSRFVVRDVSFTHAQALMLVKNFIVEAWSRLNRRFGPEVADRKIPQFALLPELTAKIKAALPPERPRPSRCFRCDGTGRLCDICGESPTACRCSPPTFSDCQDCGGHGR